MSNFYFPGGCYGKGAAGGHMKVVQNTSLVHNAQRPAPQVAGRRDLSTGDGGSEGVPGSSRATILTDNQFL